MMDDNSGFSSKKRVRSQDEPPSDFEDDVEQFYDDGLEDTIRKESSSYQNALKCQAILENNEVCGKTPINISILSNFAEQVCTSCLRQDENTNNGAKYGLVSKTNAIKEYLIPVDLIETLKFKKVLNPTNHNYAPLKLYLRKQVLATALTRFNNDPQQLEAEKQKREVKKFERNIVKMKNVMTEQANEFRSAISEVTPVVWEDASVDESSGSSSAAVGNSSGGGGVVDEVEFVPPGKKPKKTYNKVKNPALKDMIKCIRG